MEDTHVKCVETTFALTVTYLRTKWYIIARRARVILGDPFKDNREKEEYYGVNGPYFYDTEGLTRI